MTQYSSAALTRLALYKQVLDDLQERKDREAGYTGEGCLPGEGRRPHDGRRPGEPTLTLTGIVVRDATGTYTLTSDNDFNVNEVETKPIRTAEQRTAAWEQAKASRNFAALSYADLKVSIPIAPMLSTDAGNVLSFGSDGGLYCAGVKFVDASGKPIGITPVDPAPGLPDPTLVPKTSEHEDFLMHADPDTLPKAS